MDVSLSLADLLARLGITDLFCESVADLSGVDGSRELYVSAALQRAVVDVNEEGTEAVAATAVKVPFPTASLQEHLCFHADRPFLFFIRHRRTRALLFLGRLTRPPTVADLGGMRPPPPPEFF